MANTTITVRIPVDLLGDIRAIAKDRSWTVSETVRDALERHRADAVAEWWQDEQVLTRWRAERQHQEDRRRYRQHQLKRAFKGIG